MQISSYQSIFCVNYTAKSSPLFEITDARNAWKKISALRHAQLQPSDSLWSVLRRKTEFFSVLYGVLSLAISVNQVLK